MRRKFEPTGTQQIVFDAFGMTRIAGILPLGQYHIGDNDRASDGTAARLDQGHAHSRIGIEHGLHFFRVDLQPGEYDMRCSGIEGAGSMTLKITTGEARFVEVAARLGIGSARCTIFEATDQQGRSAIAHSKRAAEIK